MNKKLLMLITAIVMIASLCVGVAACAKTFDAPANVKVDGNTLKWDAVEGAESYTVKINDDETTNNVKTTSLDLTSVTAKLKTGANTLAVKVNASESLGESVYSETVTYTYTPTPVKTAFNAPTNVKVEGDTLKWDAVTGATNGYTVKINTETNTVNATTNSLDLTTVTAKLSEGTNTLAVMVNATADKNASNYAASSNTYTYTAQKPQFNAPTNVRVEGDTLKWDAVDGATNGYTVKINTETNTKTVDTNSLDLTTVTTMLQKGNNTLSVMVNATAQKDASGYTESSTNPYVYTPTVEKEIADLAALVEEFETALAAFNAEQTVANAQAVQAAITAVENKYEGISQEAKDQVTEQAAAFMQKAEAFETLYSQAETAYNAFVEALNAALAEVDKEESLTALNEKIAALTQATEALGEGTLARNMVTSQQEQQGQDIGAAYLKWRSDINAAKAELTITLPELTDDESAEAIIVAVAEIRLTYQAYPAYVKADATVAEKYQALANADEGAIAKLVATVEGIVEQIPQGSDHALTREYYEQLTALKETIDSLGTYAKALLSAEDTTNLYAEIARVENTPTQTLKGETYSISGVTLKVTIFRTFINCLGDKIEATESNRPTISVNGTGITASEFTKNSLNEYVAVITIENTGNLDADSSYTVVLGSSEDTSSLHFGEVLGNNPYFTNEDTADGFKNAINDQGNFVFTKQGECQAEHYYLDVYMAGSIIKDDAFVNYTQMPIGRIEITDWESPVSIKELNRYLARNFSDIFVGKGDVSVQFAIYGTKEEGGKLSFTVYNASVISGAITFNLTENDKYYELPSTGMDLGIWNNEDNVFSLINPGTIEGLYTFINGILTQNGISNITISDDNAEQYIGILFEAIASDGSTFTKILPLKNQGYSYKKLIADWTREFYTAYPEAADGKAFSGVELYITYCILDGAPADLKTLFPIGVREQLHDGNQDVMTKVSSVTLDKTSITLPNNGMRKNGGGDAFEFLRDTTIGNGKLLTNGDADYLIIKFYLNDTNVEGDVYYAYLLDVEGNAFIYKNLADLGKDDVAAKIQVAITADAWININAFKEFVERYYVVDGYALRWDDGWTFTSKYKLSDDSTNYLFEGDWSEPIVFEGKSYDFTSDSQVKFDDNNFIFFDAFTPDGGSTIARGGIFMTGAVDRVELHFYQGESESTQYFIYMTYNATTQKIEFYYDNGDVKTAFTVPFNGGDDMNNGWCSRAWLESAIREYLQAIGADVDFTGVWNMYTVTHLRNGSKVFKNGDAQGNVKSDSLVYTVTEND